MSLVVLPRLNDGAAKARIGYQNLMELGEVAASSEDASYPVANCFDGNTSDFFKPASGGGCTIDLTLDEAATVDYLAFYNQSFYQFGGSIKLQYNNGAGYVDASPVVAPTDNSPRMIFFDPVSSAHWRVVISCSGVFSLAVLSFGEHLGFPRPMYLGWTPPILARSTRILDSMSEGGQFLGRSRIANGVDFTINLNNAPDAWVRESWLPFIKVAETKGFFFAPNVASYPNEAVFCWTNGAIPAPQHVHFGYMSASIPVKGMIE